MFDIGWTELLVIGVVALIVVGPKDLPAMFRALGQFTAKARGMAREFQRAMESAADEAGVKDVGEDLKKMTSARNLGLDKLQDAAKGWDTKKSEASKAKAKGPETQKLSEERAEAARKAHETAARKAEARQAADVQEQPAAPPEPGPSDPPETERREA